MRRRALQQSILQFELKIRRESVYSSHAIAEGVVSLVENAIEMNKVEAQLEQDVKFICKQLKRHFPRNVIIGNVCDNILGSLKTEVEASQFKRKGQIVRSHSKSFLEFFIPRQVEDEILAVSEFRTRMLDALNLMSDDLSNSYEQIATKAHNFLFARDIILTVGLSNSVLKFLAEKKEGITVVIPERAPEYDGEKMAQKLREEGITVIVIPDSAVFAILPKIDKIIVSAHAVFANGGIVSFSLVHSIALAAKHHATPVIVLYWQMKLTKTVPVPGKSFAILRQPEGLMDGVDAGSSNIVPISPELDYIPPDLLTLLIDEYGERCPHDIFSLVQANYDDA